MRVLALIHDAFGGQGGIAKFNRDFLTALANDPDVEEVVALPRYIVEPYPALPPKLQYDAAASSGKFAYAARNLAHFIFGARFDVVVCGHISLLPFAALWVGRAGRPMVLILHGTEAWEPRSRWIVSRFRKRIDRFIPVSGLTRDRFAAWSGYDLDKAVVLPNCVELSRYAPGPKPQALVDRYGLAGRRVIMTLGRLETTERLKGFDEVLDVMSMLTGEFGDVVYLIGGDGNDRERLEAKTRSLGLSDRVVFTGYIAEEEKADHYRLCDAFVLASRGEGFGIVLLEALASGIPALGSRIDGTREALLDGELGVLVDPDDPDELCAGIRQILSRPRGDVPERLSFYSYAAYEKRVHDILKGLQK